MGTIKVIVISFLSGLAGSYAFYKYKVSFLTDTTQYSLATDYKGNFYKPTITNSSNSGIRDSTVFNNIDFSGAASQAVQSVVYINSISQSRSSYSYWDMLFNGGSNKQISSGSGVIFTADGYIVTNNHVIQSAETIEVIYNKKVYQAELIGSDPSTDIAVLKIEEENLTAMVLGNSKDLLVGEWVVAVGNPFSLSSTITAGIVSAKGRRINIVDDKFPIESFIQTDAAINPGNSGGALVNRRGELVGINTAILSHTGSYTGYAFAVPIDIVKKIVKDIIRYGIVQKPFFGARMEEYDFQHAKKYNLDTEVKDFKGILITGLDNSGAAKKAGLQLGDIIIRFDDVIIDTKSDFEEELSYHSPGETIKIIYLRNDKERTISLILVNKDGNEQLIRRKIYDNATVGAMLEAVEYGVKIFKIKEGLFQKIGIPENYTIISLNRRRVKSPQEVIDFFENYQGQVFLYGITSSKKELPLSFYLE